MSHSDSFHSGENVADEFIELSFIDPASGEVKRITSTPGHVYLTAQGEWRQLSDMLQSGNSTDVIARDGDVVTVDFGTAGNSDDTGSPTQRLTPSLKIFDLAIPAGQTQIVLADGTIVESVAWSVAYSAATADLYEQAQMLVTHSEHGLALKPEYKKGWKTYNFEVAGTHTYIADGVRVHNSSELGTAAFGKDANNDENQISQAA